MAIPKKMKQHWVYKTILDNRKKKNEVLGFRSENGYLQVVEEEQKKRGRTILAKHPPGQERGANQRLFMSFVS